ncbi:hypothetical protein [Komagataeibacter nataicola]|uniref:hypothetical protein n=1 Tax=Komagataeibacter nataicola TaxID=265960 RepID=UPI0023DD3F3D|nr:hypothetical protein [Komagataeibacter nataicola]
MLRNNKIMNIFIKIIPFIFLSGCIYPHAPKVPFNGAEVAWAKKNGNATVKGCVSGGNYTKYKNTILIPYDNVNKNNNIPIKNSFSEYPQNSYTIDFLPETEYMHILEKKMHAYSIRLMDYENLNDPRWVEPSILPYIPHFSCPDSGPDICTSIGHFVFSNLPAGNWYVVVDYHSTPLMPGHAVVVQKFTTVANKTVRFISWFGSSGAELCTP